MSLSVAEKISVIIPSFNHSKYIEELIESVFSQNYSNLELIVVDDGSTDSTRAVLDMLQTKYDFKTIYQKNQGVCSALNMGIQASVGSFIVPIASDDVMSPNRLEEQVNYLLKNESVDVVTGAVELIDITGEYISMETSEHLGFVSFVEMLKKNTIFAATVMMRRTAWNIYGPYPENTEIEDFFMWLNILSKGGIISVTPNVWAKYRKSSTNIPARKLWYYRGAIQALKAFKEIPGVKKALFRFQFKYIIWVSLATDVPIVFTKDNILCTIPTSACFVGILLRVFPHKMRRGALKYLEKI